MSGVPRRTLNSNTQVLLDLLKESGGPSLEDMRPDEARSFFAAGRAFFAADPQEVGFGTRPECRAPGTFPRYTRIQAGRVGAATSRACLFHTAAAGCLEIWIARIRSAERCAMQAA